MTEQEYIDVVNLTAVRIIRDALKWSHPDAETAPHFRKINNAASDLTVILNKRDTSAG